MLRTLQELTECYAYCFPGFGHLADVRFVVHPLAAEHLDTMCDVGSDVNTLKEKFSDERIDWSIVEAMAANGAEWWYRPTGVPSNPPPGELLPLKEPKDAVMRRIEAFKADLLAQDDACLVVVGHSSFFRAMVMPQF